MVVKYKPHPWVSSVYFRILDENHIRVYIDLSSKGKYAEAGIWSEERNELTLSKDRTEYETCDEDLKLILPDGKWDLCEDYSGKYTIFFLLVRQDFKRKEGYWTQADAKRKTTHWG